MKILRRRPNFHGTGGAPPQLAHYIRLSRDGDDDPYARYNSLLRRLVGRAAALEHEIYRRRSSGQS